LEIKLQNKNGMWDKKDRLSFIGGLDEDVEQQLLKIVSNEKITTNSLEEVLIRNKQFFSLLIETEDFIFAAVDHLRMFPLFFATNKGDTYLSDDIYWVRDRLQENSIDEIAETEFLMAGYVTGSDTLYKNIKQLQAGEYLFYNRKQGEIHVKQYNKYAFIKKTNQSKQEAIFELDDIHLTVFKRLIRSLRGRTAVVPLSAGYDSRAIVMMLKRLGYENVICFTYGVKDSSEVKTTREVAKMLGYKWIFIEYTSEKWKNWIESKEMKEYFKSSDNLVSLPHIQDHIAITELKANKLIPDDSIIVPGHTAFLSFSEYNLDNRNIKQLVTLIMRKHFNLWDWSYKNSSRFKDIIGQKIIEEINSLHYLKSNLDNLFYFWETKERHAKFICNSVRAYEQHNFEWRLPLWEKEMMDFWLKTPQEYRINKQVYKEYYKQFLDLDKHSLVEPNKESIRQKVIKSILQKNAYLHDILVKIANVLAYYKHPLKWYKIISLYLYIKGQVNGAKNINSYLVDKRLQYIFKGKNSLF
jgi:asparagine synthase (glutamine-hydrolysing)